MGLCSAMPGSWKQCCATMWQGGKGCTAWYLTKSWDWGYLVSAMCSVPPTSRRDAWACGAHRRRRQADTGRARCGHLARRPAPQRAQGLLLRVQGGGRAPAVRAADGRDEVLAGERVQRLQPAEGYQHGRTLRGADAASRRTR